jgi:hypothetical protein
MSHAKRFGWVLLGILIGGFAAGSVDASRQTAQPRRLVALEGSTLPTEGSAYFIKDTKTGACWLTIRSRDDISGALAPAPRESCEP